ncbi:MAG: hypothetical protein HYT72_02080 [Candidatus Aenigmarchaeota archaeon]|nr:hypothetical protein [Candidatus Aenigmarchaeota archaeon]
MAKGMTLVTLIVLILVLVIFVGFLVRLLFDTTNESLEQQLSMRANEIAGIINLLQASPSGTFHVVELNKDCTVEISPDNVVISVQSQPWIPTLKLTTLRQSSKSGIIKTALSIEPAKLECKDGAAYIMRCLDTIKASQKTKPCE